MTFFAHFEIDHILLGDYGNPNSVHVYKCSIASTSVRCCKSPELLSRNIFSKCVKTHRYSTDMTTALKLCEYGMCAFSISTLKLSIHQSITRNTFIYRQTSLANQRRSVVT